MKRLHFSLFFLVVINALGVVQSCILFGGRCSGETTFIFADVEDITVEFRMINNQNTISRDAVFIDLWLQHDANLLGASTSLQVNQGIITGALAVSECEEFEEISYNQVIEELNIYQGELDITRDFVVGSSEGPMYVEIEEAMASQLPYLGLVYTKVPEGHEVSFLVETLLSDGRLLRDTLSAWVQ